MAESLSLVAAVYLALPALSIVASVLLGSYIYQYHWDERGATSFVLILVTGTIWVGLLFGHVLLTDPALLVPIATVELLAALASFAVFTLFVSRYTGSGYHRSRAYQGAFAILVGGLAVLAATNQWHGLVYRDYRIATQPFTYVAFDHGLGWVLAIVLVSLMAGYSAYVLVEDMLSTAGRTGMQLVMLVGAIFSVAAAEALGRTGLFPAVGFHHAAYGTLPWVGLMTFALFRFRLFDMQPVARNVVVETLDLPTTGSRTTSHVTLPVDDEQRHYSVQVSTIRRRKGETADWYAIVLRDVTELEQSRWQLEKQNERLDQVATTISHDLRNPITVADGYVEVVREDFLADDELDRMEQIIDDVLTLAREGKSVAETQHLDVETIATEAWENVDTKDATLSVQESASVAADRGRLLTIFENLFRNALDHGRPDVTVAVGTTEQGFFVADNGPGIPAARRDDVFEYGFTTDDGGTGLGLSIVRTMAESHGWTVDIDPEYDTGARFEFVTVSREHGREESAVTLESDS
jgi:signal transduction histidine kinase/uncharacterized membrane protein YidH (DUF202 family)